MSEEHFNENIKKNWEKLREVKVDINLKVTPIDTMSTLEKRIPINELMYHELKTIYDVRNKIILDLKKLDGIGIISAEAIVDATSKIIASVYKQVYPRIDPENLSKEDEDLIESIYKKKYLLNKSKVLNSKVTEFSKQVKDKIDTAKARKGVLLSLFQSDTEKERIQKAFDELNNEIYITELNELKEELLNISIFKASREEFIDHFIKNNASYYTEIEKVTKAEQAKDAESLPIEIVEMVNSYPLDATGLKLDLRGYQEFGAKYSLHYKRTLLGDEMGLDKTIQALAMINHLSQNKQI